MKTTLKLFLILGVLLSIFIPAQIVQASGLDDGQVIFGSNYTLASGESLHGDLLVFGGTVTVETGAIISGDIVLFGGNLTVAGEVNGDLVLIGGSGILKSTAVVNGDLNSVGGSFVRESGATVHGSLNNFDSPPVVDFELPGRIITPNLPQLPGDIGRLVGPINFNPFSEFAWLLIKSMGWAALAALVLLFFDKYTYKVSRAVVHQPLIGGSIGFLTVLAVIVISVIMIITIILIPAALVAILLLGFAIAFGWISVGMEVGNRLAVTFNQEWSAPLSAALGTFVLNFVANGIGFIPCIGWLVPFIVSMIGLGAVFLSRFGTQPYPQETQMSPDPVEVKEISADS
ncbi:polymer-forming cytoskeletal protein [Chloroflexota bacterium]